MPGKVQHLAAAAFLSGLVALTLAGPAVFDLFELLQLTTFATLALATMGLAFLWGTLGVLNFGHAAFFGLGAYAFAMTTLNLGDSTYGLPAAVLLPALFAAGLGYFLFFSRISDVYLAVVTLCVSLILFSLMNSTSDPVYRVGTVMLGGFNGINGIPPLNWPLDPDAFLSPEAMFRLTFFAISIVYALLYLLSLTATGRVMKAVRENELRTELLGYDVRLLKLGGFMLSAAIAGLSGALFASSAGFVGPTVFGLAQASQFLLWVLAGGLGTVAGPILASFGFQYLVAILGTSQVANTSLVFGAIIILFVCLVPRGLLPTFTRAAGMLASRFRRERNA